MSIESSPASSINKKSQKHKFGIMGRNLMTNNTICEVSERDSDFDDRTRTIKRSELKSSISKNSTFNEIVIEEFKRNPK